jgi:hypothetical protein
VKVRQSESAPTSRLVGVSRPTRTIIELPAGVTDCTTKAWYPSFTHDLRGRLRWQPTPGENSPTFGGVVVALPLAARAQDPERMRFIGVLMPYAESDPGGATNLSALRQGLQQLGWMEGRNVRFEHRWPTPDAHSMGKLAKELVDLRP